MIVLLLASAFFWAAGSLVSQRHAAHVSATALAGMQLVCGGVVLLVVSALAGEWDGFSARTVTAVSWAGLAYLTLVGSVFAFSTYVWLLDHASAPLVASYTFVSPVFALLLGWFLLDERLTTRALLGTILVIGSVAAVWLENARRPDRQGVRDPSGKPAIIPTCHPSAGSPAWPR
jgi:drug/metabolite transporter (DMT)-like permease